MIFKLDLKLHQEVLNNFFLYKPFMTVDEWVGRA